MNLLKETTTLLKENGKTLNDIIWFGTCDFKIPLEKLSALLDLEYDNGFGGTQVACDLLLVGKDFWLERHEYDGAEWWEYKTAPTEPVKTIDVEGVLEFYCTGLNDRYNKS